MVHPRLLGFATSCSLHYRGSLGFWARGGPFLAFIKRLAGGARPAPRLLGSATSCSLHYRGSLGFWARGGPPWSFIKRPAGGARLAPRLLGSATSCSLRYRGSLGFWARGGPLLVIFNGASQVAGSSPVALQGAFSTLQALRFKLTRLYYALLQARGYPAGTTLQAYQALLRFAAG